MTRITTSDASNSLRPKKRRRISHNQDPTTGHNDSSNHKTVSDTFPDTFPAPTGRLVPIVDPDLEIPRIQSPSMAQFEKHMHEQARPVILTHTIDHWPASKLWHRPKYWYDRTIAGRRLVPIELGKTYVDEGWGQRIVPFRQFMFDHLLRDQPSATNNGASQDADSSQRNENQDSKSENDLDQKNAHFESVIGYLAQHDLLSQIPSLRSDIAIPDYC